MSYDVFLVAAPTKEKDREMARLVARRLRSMKMRVWYDAKAEDDVFDAKEARAIERSSAMLVLWSKSAVQSNFVRGAAAQGYSLFKDGESRYPFIQAALDDVEPYDPYSVDDLHDLSGFTTRTNTDGWFEIIGELEEFQGRKDLKDWLLIPTKDREAQDAWREAHPDDRLAVKGTPPGKKKKAVDGPPASKPAASAGGAAAVTASSVSAGMDYKAPSQPAPGPSPAPASAPSPASPAATTQLSARSSSPSRAITGEQANGGAGTIAMILALIALMFLLAWLFRSLQAPRAAGLPPVAGASYLTCPPGTMPRDVFQSRLLETAPVADDSR